MVVMLLLGAAAGAAGVWYFKPGDAPRGAADSGGANVAANGDIVCTGRIDTKWPIIPLYPKLPGQVISVSADETLAVSRGQLLMELDPTPYKRKQDLAKANAEMAKAALVEAESEAAKFAYTIEQARLGVKSAEHERDLANKELKSAREKKAEPVAPNAAIVVTDEMIDQLELRSKLAQLKVDYSASQVESLTKTNLESKVAQARAARDAANAQLQEADDAVNDCRVLAPSDGSVLRVQVSPGSQVAPGSPLVPMMFAPAGPMVVRAELDQEHVGKVEPGYACTFQDISQPNAAPWEGTVLSVSKWVARQRNILFDPLEINDVRTMEVVIEVKKNSATGKLLLGQRVRVRIKPLNIP
jgi:multidrug resistance efflux pump